MTTATAIVAQKRYAAARTKLWPDMQVPSGDSVADSSDALGAMTSTTTGWSATLTAAGASADPSAGSWRTWVFKTQRGTKVAQEWEGAIRIIRRTLPADVIAFAGYATEADLASATCRAILYGAEDDGSGGITATIHIKDGGTWTTTTAPNPESPSPGVHGGMFWGIDASGSTDSRIETVMSRPLEPTGRPSHSTGKDARVNTADDWVKDNFMQGDYLHLAVGFMAGAALSSVSAEMRPRHSILGGTADDAMDYDEEPVTLLGIGQSNMVGHGSTPWAGSAIPAGDGPFMKNSDYYSAWPTSGGHGPEVGLLISNSGPRRAMLTNGAGGQDMATMLSTYYPAAVSNASITGLIPRAMVIIQGEADSTTEADSLAWGAQMDTLVSNARAQWGASLPVVFVELQTTDAGYAWISNINDYATTKAASDDDFYTIDPVALGITGATYFDGLHYTEGVGGGYEALGEAIGDWMVARGLWGA